MGGVMERHLSPTEYGVCGFTPRKMFVKYDVRIRKFWRSYRGLSTS